VLPNLDRAQQKGLLVLSALVLSYGFISHWAGLPPTPPLTPVVITARQEVHIELAGAVQRPGLYPYPQPPTVSRVIEDGGGLTGKSEIPAQRGKEVLTKDTRMAISVDNAQRVILESGPLSIRSLWILGRPLPVNQATAEDLDRLPGIGPGLAQRIVDYREQQGPFPDLESLKEVKGIKGKTLEKIRPYLTIP
jgi:competence protein ComEA